MLDYAVSVPMDFDLIKFWMCFLRDFSTDSYYYYYHL